MTIEERKVTSEELQSNTASIIKKFIESASQMDLYVIGDYLMDEVDAETIKAVMGINKHKVRDEAKVLPIIYHPSLADFSANKVTKDIDPQMNMRIK